MKPEPGSISHGTLRPQDLLRTFARELERLDGSNGYYALLNEARGLADELDNDGSGGGFGPREAAGEVIDELSEQLNARAPEGFYFGAHEGDGADFGFWAIEGGE